MKNIKLITEQDSVLDLLGDRCGEGVAVTTTSLVGHDLSARVFLGYIVSDGGVSRVMVASVLPDGTIEWQVDVLGAVDEAGALDEKGDGVRSCLVALDATADALTIGLSTGHVFSLDISSRCVTEVGWIDGGVAGLSYSPDGELMAVVSGLGQVLLLTCGWEVLMEMCVVEVNCDMPQATAVVEEEVGAVVGGGDTKEWFREARGVLRVEDVGVSWRGDGKYFATSVRCGGNGRNSPGRVRIWDVEKLSLHALGEQSPGALPVVAWQPNGRTLCVANHLSDAQVEEMAMLRLTKQDVGGQGQAPEVRHVGAWKRELRRRQEAQAGQDAGPSRVFIYERNGLQHGDFVVPGDGVRIEHMAWSSDSRTLAMVVVRGEEGEEGEDGRGVRGPERSLQIWCRSNWKWYNKWTRTFGAGERVLVAWHEGPGGTTLTALTSSASSSSIVARNSQQQLSVLSKSKLAWDYDVSGYGTVAVVDGGSLLMTPMRQCMIPPPLCAIEIYCGRPIVSVLFMRMPDGRETVGALLDDGRLAMATCPEADDWELMLDIHGGEEGSEAGKNSGLRGNRIRAPVMLSGAGNHHFRHAAFLGTRQVVFVGQSMNGVDSLFEYGFENDVLQFENCIELEAHVSRLVRFGDSSALLEFEDGRCLLYSVDGSGGTVGPVEGFGKLCDVVRVVPGHSSQFSPAGPPVDSCILGLHVASGCLYRNGKLIASDATSVGVHTQSAGGPHLLYTTRNNVLKTQPLFGDDKDAVSRAIEDGCVLVSLPEGSVDVVMQAPRGNLEIIRPRALVLPAVESALDRRDFAGAWRLATVNRLDMNVLVNYRWPALLENARKFIDEVGSDTDVAGFLQSLELDVQNDIGISMDRENSRLHQVCEAFRNELAGDRAWLRTELTSHSKCGDIGKALLRVKEIKELEMNNMNSVDNVGMQPTAEMGLKHVLLHNPENAVYEAALGEYELQLAYMVVAHVQRDPGEYLTQLQEFAVIDNEHIRQAAIDRHLGRFDKAVENLFEAGSFGDALELAASKDLLKHLLALVDAAGVDTKDSEGTGESRSAKRQMVLKALGEHLSTKGKYEDAALAFIAAEDLEQALRSYRLASAWRPALTLAARLAKGESFIKDLARRLSDDLEEFQPIEAARIQLDYLDNLPAAVRLFAQGGEWREALRLATGTSWRRDISGLDLNSGNDSTSSSNASLMEILVSVASSSAVRLLDGFLEDAARVEKYWSRLRDLREKRIAMEVLEGNRGDDAVGIDDDAFIETASMATDMSMFSMLTDATATSTSTFASFASTVGGRRKNRQKQSKKKNKIRRGSPEEEDQLAKHLITLLPKSNTCEECGQLAEFLVYIGHEDDAIKLQSSLKALIDKASAAADDVEANPPPGRQMNLPYRVREGIFDEAGPGVLLKVDRHVASVAEPELQLQVQEGKTNMTSTGWKWELLRRQ